MPLSDATQRLVTQATLTLRKSSPFFAALALFAQVHERTTIPTAATDGKDIFVNPAYLASLKARQRAGLLLHEVLHAALLHVLRRGPRDSLLWNIAADVVVNGMIAKQGAFELPPGGVRETTLEHLSVEEVYSRLLHDPAYQSLIERFSPQWADLIEVGQGGALGEARREQVEAHWRDAIKQAEVIARSSEHGSLPLGMQRELGMASEAKIDWRSRLWQFLVRTPTDFQGFDRRQIGQGYYLEALEGESVFVAVAVDTSGSIRDREIAAFTGEIRGILGSYPHIRCELYYADVALYGPYPLTPSDPLPPPEGGGGTDFRPFFQEITRPDRLESPAACIYLTDGFGYYPEEPPGIPTLWVVTSGGIDLNEVPFGETIRLLLDD
jgi:predicted metal-dependent peptidase